MNPFSSIRWSGVVSLFSVFAFVACCVATTSTDGQDAAKSSHQMHSLFDGKTLDGWEAGGHEAYFRVEDGCIVAGTLSKKIPHNYFLCTKETFGDFELSFEAKLVGKGDNAGVQFRSRRVPDSSEVSGYQADIGVAWDRSVWGALYDESRRRKMLAEPDADLGERIVKSGQWNRMRVVANCPSIQIFVNGTKTVDYTEEDDSIARRGVIGLQIHSGPPGEAWYRNLKLRRLPSEP